MFPQAGMRLAMCHRSINQLISYPACHAQCYHQRSCSAFKARSHCRPALLGGHECIWYPRCHIWRKERRLIPFRNFHLLMLYSFQHFLWGLSILCFLLDIYQPWREVRGGDVPSQIPSCIPSFLSISSTLRKKWNIHCIIKTVKPKLMSRWTIRDSLTIFCIKKT